MIQVFFNRKGRKGFAKDAISFCSHCFCKHSTNFCWYCFYFTFVAQFNNIKINIITENELSKIVFDSGMQIHKVLGPGLLESAYEECLFYELKKNGLFVEKQKPLPLIYQDVKLEVGYRIDLLVERKIIIEIKSVESLSDVHLAQILTYLKLSGCKLGLLINFNTFLFRNGVKRVANNL